MVVWVVTGWDEDYEFDAIAERCYDSLDKARISLHQLSLEQLKLFEGFDVECKSYDTSFEIYVNDSIEYIGSIEEIIVK